MKKVILAALALFLVMGIAAAQEIKIGEGELTLSGGISSGLSVGFNDSSDEAKKGTVTIFNDAGNFALRTDLNIAYTNGNAGLKTKLRVNNTHLGDKASVFVPYAFGWFNLFDGIIRPVGGLIDDNVWGTKGDLGKDVTGAGIRLEIKPIEGLNFGAFLRVPRQAGNVIAQGTVNGIPGGIPGGIHVVDNRGRPIQDANGNEEFFLVYDGLSNLTIEQFLRATALGLAYDTDAFYVRLQYLIDASPHTTKFNTVGTEDLDGNGQLDFGIGFTGVPGLTASVEGRLTKLDYYVDGRGYRDFRETVSYTVSDALPLTVKLNAREFMYADEDLDTWIRIAPTVTYALSDALTVGLGGGFGLGTAPNRSFVSGAGSPEYGGTYESDITVGPTLSYTFAKGFAVDLSYTFETAKLKSGGDPVNSNTIQLDFAYAF
jgi:hypothetical protein